MIKPTVTGDRTLSPHASRDSPHASDQPDASDGPSSVVVLRVDDDGPPNVSARHVDVLAGAPCGAEASGRCRRARADRRARPGTPAASGPDKRRDREHHIRDRAQRAPRTRRRHARPHPDPRDRSCTTSLPHRHDLHHLPARLTPDCLLVLLLPCSSHARQPAACRRPASGPPATCLGCPQIYLAGRGRGVQREALDPPSSNAPSSSHISPLLHVLVHDHAAL